MSTNPAKPKKLDLSSYPDSEQNGAEANTKTNQPEPELNAEFAVDENEEMSQNQNSADIATSAPAGELSVKPIAFSEDEITMKKKAKKLTVIICFVALIAGVGTGFGVHQLQHEQSGEASEPIQQVAGDKVQVGDVFGLKETEIFKDTAVGYLEIGGINGEGSHRLLRPGGESQTVYLTSTATDLDRLAGMEVKVWGETYKGQQAGWLMDVGKIEVLQLEAEPPFEEEL